VFLLDVGHQRGYFWLPKEDAMSYLVIATYDLSKADPAEYPPLDAELEKAGLVKSLIHSASSDEDVPLPGNIFTAKVEGASAADVRDEIRTKMKAAFKKRGGKGRIFVAVGRDWAWIAGVAG
jgi:hypothetical protein